VGLHADPYFDPEFFERKNAEKQLIPKEISCFMSSHDTLDAIGRTVVPQRFGEF
jgi:hypothetical protein